MRNGVASVRTAVTVGPEIVRFFGHQPSDPAFWRSLKPGAFGDKSNGTRQLSQLAIGPSTDAEASS